MILFSVSTSRGARTRRRRTGRTRPSRGGPRSRGRSARIDAARVSWDTPAGRPRARNAPQARTSRVRLWRPGGNRKRFSSFECRFFIADPRLSCRVVFSTHRRHQPDHNEVPGSRYQKPSCGEREWEGSRRRSRPRRWRSPPPRVAALTRLRDSRPGVTDSISVPTEASTHGAAAHRRSPPRAGVRASTRPAASRRRPPFTTAASPTPRTRRRGTFPPRARTRGRASEPTTSRRRHLPRRRSRKKKPPPAPGATSVGGPAR